LLYSHRYGTKEAKQKVFPYLSKGRSFLGIATTEPEVGSDLANMKTVAKRVGDEYVINGEAAECPIEAGLSGE